jgi:hypothetical protein
MVRFAPLSQRRWTTLLSLEPSAGETTTNGVLSLSAGVLSPVRIEHLPNIDTAQQPKGYR